MQGVVWQSWCKEASFALAGTCAMLLA
jgi:hypothetical protein